jgi:hypothetical protein
MKTDIRSQLLTVLEEFGRRYPNWRFGQMVANVAGMADTEIWDVEDEQLLEAAVKHLESRFGHPVTTAKTDQATV